MDIRSLTHFVSAVDHGSIGKAAVVEHRTQPAITRSIKNLETELGVPLFDRTPLGVVLTPYGARLVEYARLIINTKRQATLDVQSMIAGERGHVAIGVGSYFASDIIPTVISCLLERPQVRITCLEDSFEDLYTRLRSGDLDIVYSIFPATKPDPDVVFERLFPVSTHIWARESHPLTRRKKVSDRELLAADWVAYDGENLSRFSTEFFARLGAEPPVVRVRANTVAIALSAMTKHDLIAVLPDLSVRMGKGRRRFVIVRSDHPPPRIYGGIAYRKSAITTGIVAESKRLIRELIKNFARDPMPADSSIT